MVGERTAVEDRTLDTEIERTMHEAIWLWTRGQPDEWDEAEEYLYKVLTSCSIKQVDNGEQTGAFRLAELDKRTDLPGDNVQTWSEWIREKLRVACAYASEAMIASYRGETNRAWCALIDARTQVAEADRWWRMKWVELVEIQAQKDSRKMVAAKAALASHAENHDAQKQVRDHFIANRSSYRSKDEAAERIAGTLVPHAYRTVRKWLNGI